MDEQMDKQMDKQKETCTPKLPMLKQVQQKPGLTGTTPQTRNGYMKFGFDGPSSFGAEMFESISDWTKV